MPPSNCIINDKLKFSLKKKCFRRAGIFDFIVCGLENVRVLFVLLEAFELIENGAKP